MSREFVRMKESTPHLKGWRRLRRGFQGLMRVASLSLVAILGLALAGCSHGSSNHDSAPVITSQPQGTTVISGHPVNLYVSVAGTSPFTYQWTRNGQTLVGAQSSVLTLNNPGVQDSGQYVVTVTNSLG
ncbi:MAG TPA: immunoglobulin domain-containing protein, partial [Holophagaceae bacterium]